MKYIEIERLIPQRDPIVMVDELIEVREEVAVTGLTVRTDNYFIDEEGLLAEPGLIEHIAQSASAFAGYRAISAGATDPPVGYIGEVKKFHCYRRPQPGEELHTTITMGAEMAGVTIITGETRIADEIVADTQMKIFIQPND
ncbi:beta-hydroxyacyl-ACP dehydratase [Bacteroides sp. GD17]|jgi:predicted hotdog family 3-hydroxylacyl-ACP dehydratase|uniref:beta-hydroxyacyl-ACP dehydratase n=1 Tax=Bacteroides sp. GD17 TaxID=3139826 RepID=UPI0025E50AE6|nr:beta-hydroxyacyl-ACP dehydratase [uncultured Bacteroides sp.]